MSTTIVPLGSLALLFAGVSLIVLLMKTIIAKETDKAIQHRMAEKRAQKNRPLMEQKKRLEELLKK